MKFLNSFDSYLKVQGDVQSHRGAAVAQRSRVPVDAAGDREALGGNAAAV